MRSGSVPPPDHRSAGAAPPLVVPVGSALPARIATAVLAELLATDGRAAQVVRFADPDRSDTHRPAGARALAADAVDADAVAVATAPVSDAVKLVRGAEVVATVERSPLCYLDLPIDADRALVERLVASHPAPTIHLPDDLLAAAGSVVERTQAR